MYNIHLHENMSDQKKLKKIILFLIALIIVTGAVGYVYYQRNIFGDDRLRFEIEASEEVEAGEVMEYTLRYRNNSDIRLENVNLIFEYPQNMEPMDEEEDEDIVRRGEGRREVKIGELNPGEERTTIFHGRPFGKKGDSLRAQAEIRYIPKNLTARYSADREHMAKINRVPIDLSFEIPSTVDPSKEEGIRLRFSSEIELPISDLEIRLDYPEGFDFVRSTPETDAEDNDTWSWSMLNEGEDGTIDIEGVLRGEPGDGKVFSAVLGIWRNERFIPLTETSRGTSLSESDLIVDIQVNGDIDYIASPGELLHYEVFIRNVGEKTLEDLFLLVDLDRNTLNLERVEPVDGRFQEERGVIIWSHAFDSGFHSLKEGEEERVEFWAEVKERDLPYEPEIDVKASIERARKEIATKVGTILLVDAELLREDSPFEESGPFPFEVEEKSSYTVKWEIESSFNDFRNVAIKTTLPEDARVTGEKYPTEASLSFDSDTGEVKIEKDHFSAGVGEEVFLEVEIEPREELMEGDVLVGETSISGEDRHTGERRTVSVEELTLKDLLEK